MRKYLPKRGNKYGLWRSILYAAAAIVELAVALSPPYHTWFGGGTWWQIVLAYNGTYLTWWVFLLAAVWFSFLLYQTWTANKGDRS